MQKLKGIIGTIVVVVVLVPMIGAMLWWNLVRPFTHANGIRAEATAFEEQFEAIGGRVVVVSSTVDMFDPATWGGLPFALDGAVPLEGDLFGYARWRDHGERLSRAYVLPDCQTGEWRYLDAQWWQEQREWLRLDVWGNPLPEDFDLLGPLQGRMIVGEVEATEMLEHERELVCPVAGE